MEETNTQVTTGKDSNESTKKKGKVIIINDASGKRKKPS